MAKKKKVEEAPKPVVTPVTVHLDRDPNDPRNVKPAEALPSLDDK